MVKDIDHRWRSEVESGTGTVTTSNPLPHIVQQRTHYPIACQAYRQPLFGCSGIGDLGHQASLSHYLHSIVRVNYPARTVPTALPLANIVQPDLNVPAARCTQARPRLVRSRIVNFGLEPRRPH